MPRSRGNAEAVELVVTLLKPDRSSQVRFQDSSARRAHLDRVLERITTERLEGRYRELDAKIDQAFLSGAPVSTEERDEHRRLREEMDKTTQKTPRHARVRSDRHQLQSKDNALGEDS